MIAERGSMFVQTKETSVRAGWAGWRAGAWLKPSISIQASYWWYFGGIGCFIPYIVLYYRQLGFSGLQMGLLTASLPLGVAILAPVWGSLADTWSAHRLILRLALAIAALAAMGVAAATRFSVILPLMALVAGMVAAVPAMLDSYALTISEREGRAYGHLRVWGSFGFIAAVWAVGWWMGDRITNIFLFAYAVSLLLACASTIGLPLLHPHTAQPMLQGVALILRNRRVALLLLTAYIVTASASIMSNYLGIYLVEIGGNTQMVGTASAFAAMSEIPVLILGRWLLQRLTSRRLLLLAIGVYVVRFLSYSVPLSPGWTLAVQLLHGLSFGAYLMSSVTLIHQLAGQRAATAQSLLSAMSLGFGAITGALGGGALLDRIGAVGAFRVAAAGMIVALVVYVLGLYRMEPVEERTAVAQK